MEMPKRNMSGNRRKWMHFLLIPLIPLLLLSPYFLSGLYIKWKRHQAKTYYGEIKDNPRVYCYDTTFGALNPAYYITDLKHKEDLIQVYDSTAVSKLMPIKFPIRFMPHRKEVILIGYMDADSTIAEVVAFNTDCWGYVHGYIDTYTMHLRPPSKRKRDEDDARRMEQEKDPVYQREKETNYHLKHSPYGLQCDEDFRKRSSVVAEPQL